MSKGKHKRKQQRDRERATKARLMNAEKIASEGQAQNTTSGTDDKANNKEPWRKRCATWIKEKSSFTDWCLVVFTGVLAGTSIYQFLIMRGQLNEMQQQTEISERPWISVDVAPDSDLTFVNGRQAVLGIKLSVKNVGKSIAKGIQIDAKLFPTAVGVPASPDAAKNQRQLCDHPELSPIGQFDLFPADNPEERVLDISAIPSAIDAQVVTSQENKSRTFVGFYVAGCISYHSSFGSEIHQTRFAYHLAGPVITPPNGKSPLILSNGMPALTGFEIGVNVPKANLGMMRELFGYNNAN